MPILQSQKWGHTSLRYFLPKVLQPEIEEQRFEPRQTSSMILLNCIT